MKTHKTIPPFKNWPKVAPQLLCAASASWAMLCTGLVRGWSSSSIPQLTAATNETIHLSTDQAAWLTSLPPLCAVFGSLLVSYPLQRYGRRLTLIAISIPYVIGFYLMGLSHYIDSVPLLFAGRVITGVMTGCSAPTAQIYVSECASPRIRGALGSLTSTLLSLGILIAYVFGAFLEWQILSMILGTFTVILGLAMVFMPETPSWLISNDMELEAKDSLQTLRGKYTDVEGEFARIKNNDNSDISHLSWARLFTKGSLMKPLLISCAVMFFQQFSGINAVIFYSATIFHEAGSTVDRFVSSITIAIVQLVCTMLSALMVDRFGRRWLLMLSAGFMSLSLGGLSSYLYVKHARTWDEVFEHDEPVVPGTTGLEHLGWIPLMCLMAFIVAYSLGFGAVPHLLMGELFPLEYRHKLSTISASFNLCCAFLVVRTFTPMNEVLGVAGVYALYAACCLAAVLFVALFLPETKGRTLEEISHMFSRPGKRRAPNDEKSEPLNANATD